MSEPYALLKERVANAKGDDREMFKDIAVALFPRGAPKDFRNRWRTLLDAEAWESAALALVATRHPGKRKSIDFFEDGTAAASIDVWPDRNDRRPAAGHGDTPALALLSALLEALGTGDEHE